MEEILTQYADHGMFMLFIVLTMGITEVFKRAFKILDRFIPLVSLVVGMFLAFTGGITIEALLLGLAVGVSAGGVFSGFKKLILG